MFETWSCLVKNKVTSSKGKILIFEKLDSQYIIMFDKKEGVRKRSGWVLKLKLRVITCSYLMIAANDKYW